MELNYFWHSHTEPMKYKHIFFDLDHTLWDFETNSVNALKQLYETEKLLEKGIVNFDNFHRRYKYINDRYWAKYHHGHATKAQVRVNRFLDALHEFGVKDADLAERDRSDSPVRLILAFDGDRSRFSAKNAMLSDLTEALTGEPLPYATLMYVWSNHRPADSIIVNPRTDRVRKLVVESGPGHLMQWRRYERDVRADFEKAFGEAPGALVGVAIMTDSDNTRSNVRAWYGDIRFD